MSRSWVNGRPLMWFGFTDMGPIQIPVVPPWIVLTDRADGVTKWWLIWDNDPLFSNEPNVGISSLSPPTGFPTLTFDAYNEPYLQGTSGLARLMVRSGVLGVDVQPAQSWGQDDVETVQLYARQVNGSLNTTMMRIIYDSTTYPNYGWTPYTYVQTPNPGS